MWRLIAWVVSRPAIADWLIKRALKTPYFHIYDDFGSLYMGRWWLFNPQDDDNKRKYSWLPSVRLHFIGLPDSQRELHDHPFAARTIILRGGYNEVRLQNGQEVLFQRRQGDTAKIDVGEFHSIRYLLAGGAITMFITGGRTGPWGFLVNGAKMNSRDYFRNQHES